MAARVPTGKPRGRPKGSVKTGGRVAAKSLDRGQRQLVNAQMAGDILAVYARLGGEDFLFKWAKENQSLYVTSVLSKLMPAAPKDGEADTYNTQINIGLSPMEAGRRVAYALARATYGDPSVNHEIDVTPQKACDWRDPVGMIREPLLQPEEDPAVALWAQELSLTDEQRHTNAAVRETKETTLESYHGSSAEQGGSVSRPKVAPKRSAAELCRSLSRRGRDLM